MSIGKIVAGIGLLIGIYLFVANGDKTVKIINSIASNTTAGIKTLQGR
jgi:hypothetical protein